MDFRLVMSDSCGSYLDHPVELVAELLGEQAGEHGAQDLAHADPKGHPWQNKNDWIIQCCTTKSIPERKKTLEVRVPGGRARGPLWKTFLSLSDPSEEHELWLPSNDHAVEKIGQL